MIQQSSQWLADDFALVFCARHYYLGANNNERVQNFIREPEIARQ